MKFVDHLEQADGM